MDMNLSNEQLFYLAQLAVFGIVFIVGLFYIARPTVRALDAKAYFSYSNGQPEVIIIGSGILGSALAVTLARDGRRVTVIERDLKQPDRIVGELLQPGGCRALKLLGLSDCTESIDAHVIKGYVVHDMRKQTNVHISYPNESDAISGGRAFHHGRFVSALRAAAMAEPNVRYIEGTVVKLIERDDGIITGVEYKERGSEITAKIHAPLTVVADGCFSRFRKGLVHAAPLTKSHFVGLIMRDCPQMIANHAELVLTDTSPVLVYQISSESTRVLVDVRDGLPPDIKAYLVDVVHPKLPEHLREPFLDAVCNEQIRTMPNSFLPSAPIFKRGVVCLGDAVNMRHALTGGGMSVALNDVILCRELFKDIPDLSDYEAVAKATRTLYAQRRMNHSFVVNVLAMALYELFAANDEHLQSLKNACFDYFKIGGRCVAGPVALLSVLEPKPYLLLGHFFAVAIYAMYVTVRMSPLVSLHRSLGRAACIFYKACCVIVPLIWSEVKTALPYWN